MTLQGRLVGLITTLVILPMIVSLAIGYFILQNRLEAFIVERLEGATQQKVKTLETYFSSVQKDFATIQDSTAAQAAFSDLYTAGYQDNSSTYQGIDARLNEVLTPIRFISGYEDIKYVLDDRRDYVAYVNNPKYNQELGQAKIAALDAVVKEAGAGLAFSKIFVFEGSTPKKYGMYVATPVVDVHKQHIGILVVMLDLTPVYDAVSSTLGLSSSGESYLLQDDQYSALYLTNLKDDPSAALTRRANYDNKNELIAERAAKGLTAGHGRGVDYRGKDVVAAWAPVSGLPWVLVTKIDRDEAIVVAKNMRLLAIIASLAIFFSVILIVWLTVFRLVERPLRSLQKVAEDLSNGHYDAKVDDSMLYQSDEFGKMATMLHHISHRLKYEASGRQDQHQVANDHPSRDYHPQS